MIAKLRRLFGLKTLTIFTEPHLKIKCSLQELLALVVLGEMGSRGLLPHVIGRVCGDCYHARVKLGISSSVEPVVGRVCGDV